MDSINIVFNEVSNTSVIWAIVVALCAVASIFIAIGMLKATKKYTQVTEEIFLSSLRPYIGRSNHIIRFIEERKVIDFSFFIKNFGNIPAKNVSVIVNVFVNGAMQPVENNKSEGQVLFPNQEYSIDFIFELHKIPDSFYRIKNGDLTFEIVTEILYNGVTKTQYRTSEKEIHNHKINSFLVEFGEWT